MKGKGKAMKVKLSKWDVQDYLKTAEERSAYIEAAIEEASNSNDLSFLFVAIGDVMQSMGNEQVANACKGLANVFRITAKTPRRKATKRQKAMA